MKKNSLRVVAGYTFLLVVVAFCLVSSIDFFHSPVNYQKLFMVVLGIAGVVLYLTKVRLYGLFLSAWILLQLVNIYQFSGGQANPLYDFHLLVIAGVNFNIPFRGTEYIVFLNFFPLFFLPFIFALGFTTLIGKEFTVRLYRENDWISGQMPQVVKVLDEINFEGNKNWLVIHLSRAIHFEGKKYVHALIKAKDDIAIRKRNKKQIAHFRLFNSPQQTGGAMALKEYPFIDWVFVE